MTTRVTSARDHWHLTSWKPLALAGLIGAVMAVVEVVVLRHLFQVPHPTDATASAAFFALASVFLVPFEEWLFRGVILSKLVRSAGVVIALILSSNQVALAANCHALRP